MVTFADRKQKENIYRMKKIIFAIIALMSCATINAQEETINTKAMDFQYGFKAGLNFTTYDSDADDFQARFGQWGIICRFKFKNWAIQPELHYAKMGVRSLNYFYRKKNEDRYDTWGYQGGKDRPVYGKFKLHLLTDNIQMPIIFKWYVPIQMWKGVNIQAGPTLSQRFDYSISTSTGSGLVGLKELNLRRPTIREFARDQNQFTVLGTYGIGFDSESGIGVDIRFSQGFTPVFKNERQTAFTHAHDRVWSLSFTYVF